MEELYLDGQRIELEPRTITQNYQVNDFADIRDRNGNFTNTINIPPTPNNRKVLDGLGVVGSQSRKAYEQVRCTYSYNSIPLINNGYAIIKDFNGSFKANIFSGNSELREELKGRRLQDIDLTDLNHTLTLNHFLTNLYNETGYVYALADYYNGLRFTININTLFPCIYVSEIFDRILTGAGFTYSGAIFGLKDFKNKVVAPKIGGIYDNDLTSRAVDFTDYLPNTSQIDFLKEIMQQFGMLFEVKDGHINFVTIAEVLASRDGAEDWSDKYSNFVSESYNYGKYGKENNLRFRYDDDDLTNYDGSFLVDNETLPESVDLFTSISAVGRFNSNGEIKHTIFEYNDDDLIVEPIEHRFVIYDLDRRFSQRYFHMADVTAGQSRNDEIPFLNFYPYQYLVERYYKAMKLNLDTSLSINCKLRLSVFDIYNLDFFKLKFIKQLGGYFYLNKIRGYKPDVLSNAELIRANEVLINKPPTVIGDVDITMPNDTGYVLRFGQLLESDPAYADPEFDDASGIKILSLPTLVTFNYQNNPITVGQEINRDDMGGLLNKIVLLNETGNTATFTDSFTFTLKDYGSDTYSSDSGTANITVEQQIVPNAAAGNDESFEMDYINPYESFSLNGAASTTPATTAWQWLLISKPAAAETPIIDNSGELTTTVSIRQTPNEIGAYTFRLSLTYDGVNYTDDKIITLTDDVNPI